MSGAATDPNDILPTEPTDTGTIKSIERERGTGSIAPDRNSSVLSDTGFTSAVAGEETFTTLQVGDRIHFAAERDPSRPGYANATAIETTHQLLACWK